MIKMEIDRGRPISSQLNSALDVQLRVFELRVPREMQFRSLGHGVKYIVAGALMVKGQIAQTHVCIDDRLLPRARSLGGKIHAAIHAHATGLKPRNTSQIKVVPIQVEAEGVGRKVVVSGPRDAGVIVGEMKFI